MSLIPAAVDEFHVSTKLAIYVSLAMFIFFRMKPRCTHCGGDIELG